MIEQIQVMGYKCLQLETPISSKAINVCVGPNASGKSTLLQALLLLRQSAEGDGSIHDLHLSGSLYEGGTAADVLHPSADHRIKMHIVDGGVSSEFSFVFDRNDAKAKRRQLKAERATKLQGALADRADGFCYLNAERIGPRVSYPLPPDDMDLAGPVGRYGEYTTGRLARSSAGTFITGWSDSVSQAFADAIERLDGSNVAKELAISEGRLDLVSNLLLNWIIPGATFDASEEENIDSAPLRYVRDPLSTKVRTRPTHMGFGLTYSLPIIAGGLGLGLNGVLLVENPEAHLHPFSQSRMGVFLALLAATGRQVFVETHSDHVVNGIRLAVRLKLIDPKSVVFNHFQNFPEEARSLITQISPDADGALEEWPAGFFDQIEKDLARL